MMMEQLLPLVLLTKLKLAQMKLVMKELVGLG